MSSMQRSIRRNIARRQMMADKVDHMNKPRRGWKGIRMPSKFAAMWKQRARGKAI